MLGLKERSQWVRIIIEKLTVVHLVSQFSTLVEPFTLSSQASNSVLHNTQMIRLTEEQDTKTQRTMENNVGCRWK
jgi:hypothetical protein